MRRLLTILVICTAACKHSNDARITPVDLRAASWDRVTQRAKATAVNFAMWAGDEERNRYFRSAVSTSLLQQYGITLHLIPIADTADAINKLLNEKGAAKMHNGSVDMVWVNGENFRTAKQANLH